MSAKNCLKNEMIASLFFNCRCVFDILWWWAVASERIVYQWRRKKVNETCLWSVKWRWLFLLATYTGWGKSGLFLTVNNLQLLMGERRSRGGWINIGPTWIWCKRTFRQTIRACDNRRTDRQTYDDNIYLTGIASRDNSVCIIALSMSYDKKNLTKSD